MYKRHALLSLIVPIWGIVDAANRSRVAFYAAGSNKTAWVVVQVAALILGLGLLMSGFYLLGPRRKVQRQLALR